MPCPVQRLQAQRPRVGLQGRNFYPCRGGVCLGFLSVTLFLVVAKVWMLNTDSSTVLQGPRVKFVALFEIEKKKWSPQHLDINFTFIFPFPEPVKAEAGLQVVLTCARQERIERFVLSFKWPGPGAWIYKLCLFILAASWGGDCSRGMQVSTDLRVPCPNESECTWQKAAPLGLFQSRKPLPSSLIIPVVFKH